MSKVKHDSQDWIEDACDILDKSRFQWILVSAVSPEELRLDSNLNREEYEKMAKGGGEDWNKIFREHAQRMLDRMDGKQ